MAADLSCDVAIVGAGMAGASLAAFLAPHRSVALLEAEDRPGRHATGRSAAMSFESYGNGAIRALTRASRAFLLDPPNGFAAAPLLAPRDCLFVADAPRAAGLDAIGALTATRRIPAAEAIARVPILDPAWLAAAVVDASGFEIDVAALHEGFLRTARNAGARLLVDARDLVLERRGRRWRLATAAGTVDAAVVVDAAGAWADEVARRAGVRPVGLVPMRRTALLVPAPAGVAVGEWPLVIDVDETFYFKPDGGRLFLSPANEDASEPCDAQADELDVALAVDRFERATTHRVARVEHRWAGLRSFVADRTPVVGFDPIAPGFFWLAGQGGYGIQTAPALARTAAALLLGAALPEDVRREGVDAGTLAPARPALR
jgi:D-arginine dehydrogenase